MLTLNNKFKKLSADEMKEIKGGGSNYGNRDCRCYRHTEPRPVAYCINNGPDPLPYCDPEHEEWYCPCWIPGLE